MVFVDVANDVSELQRHSKAACIFFTFLVSITKDFDADQPNSTRNTKTVTSERLEILETYRFKISLNAKQNLFEQLPVDPIFFYDPSNIGSERGFSCLSLYEPASPSFEPGSPLFDWNARVVGGVVDLPAECIERCNIIPLLLRKRNEREC